MRPARGNYLYGSKYATKGSRATVYRSITEIEWKYLISYWLWSYIDVENLQEREISFSHRINHILFVQFLFKNDILNILFEIDISWWLSIIIQWIRIFTIRTEHFYRIWKLDFDVDIVFENLILVFEKLQGRKILLFLHRINCILFMQFLFKNDILNMSFVIFYIM